MGDQTIHGEHEGSACSVDTPEAGVQRTLRRHGGNPQYFIEAHADAKKLNPRNRTTMIAELLIAFGFLSRDGHLFFPNLVRVRDVPTTVDDAVILVNGWLVRREAAFRALERQRRCRDRWRKRARICTGI